MSNKFKDMEYREDDRGLCFIKLNNRSKLTVDICPDHTPARISKHKKSNRLVECEGETCSHCSSGKSKLTYFRVKVIEKVADQPLEQWIDLSAHNFDLLYQKCVEVDDIAAANPFTFICESYEGGRGFNIRKSSFKNIDKNYDKKKSDTPAVSTGSSAKKDDEDDEEFEFDFDEE